MRRSLSCLPTASAIILAGLIFFQGIPRVFADGLIEDQFASILIEQSLQGGIGVVVLDFSTTSTAGDGIKSENELKDVGIRYTKKFLARIAKRVADAGKRDTVTLLDSKKLYEVLQEKKIQVVGLNELSLAAVGRALGLDLIITGNIQVEGDSLTATAKLIRLKDSEVLRLAKQEEQGNAVFIPQAPITMIDTKEKLKIGEWKVIPLSLTLSGTLNVIINVVHGNPIDLYVIPASELINMKNDKTFRSIEQFKGLKMKKYKRSGALGMGDYFLVIRDSSLGLFSAGSSDIEISAQFAP